MFTRTLNKVKSLVVLALVIVVSGGGCGDSGVNNDQGTSFLALGFFDDATGQVGRTGDILPLSSDVALDGTNDMQYWTFMGITNRLSRQFIRIVRIDCRYDVEGSFINIPNDSYGFSTVLGPGAEPPAGVGGGNGDGGDQGNLPTTVYAGFQLLSPDIFTFLNSHRSSLPTLPFRMVATCSATGVTQAGNTMTTNPINFFVQFVTMEECCTGEPGPGFQIGAGTGGDF